MPIYTPPKTIDVSLIRLLSASFLGWTKNYNNSICELINSKTGIHAFVGHSVRSIFMNYLGSQKKDFETVIFTGITLKEMADIAKILNYFVESVDINTDTQQPDNDELIKLLKQHPKAIVVLTPLFGAVVGYKETIKTARQFGAKIVIDNAQGFRGLDQNDYSDFDLLLYSFGPIKTSTALGGGVGITPDAKLLENLNQRSKDYLKDSHFSFIKKSIKYQMMIVLSKPILFTFLVYLALVAQKDINHYLTSATRGYNGKFSIARFKRNPSNATTYLMLKSLKTTDKHTLRARTSFGEKILSSTNLKIVGAKTQNHSHWLLPISSNNPGALLSALLKNGFVGTTKGSALHVVSARHTNLTKVLNQIAYIPNGKTSTKRQLKLLETIINYE